MADSLADLIAAIDNLVEAEPGTLADGATLVRLDAQLNRLDAVVTRAAGRFEATGAWAADGATTAAAWLSTRCRTPLAAARARIGAARALRAMPQVEAAWLEGSIGRPQVVSLRRAATANPTAFARDEASLVADSVRLQHRHLEQAVANWRRANAEEEAERDAADDLAARRAHLSPGMHGTGFLDACFDPISYDIFERALRTIEDELFHADWAEAADRLGPDFSVHDLARTPAQRRLDALVEMARRAQAAPPGARLPDPLFTVHLGLGSLARMCELANGTVVTPGSLIPWLEEAWIERVVREGRDRTINLGHRHRLFTGGTRRAVEVRYRECYHPFCAEPAERCEIDHIEPYANGGLTVDSNGRPACAFHNRLRNTVPDPPSPPMPEPEDDEDDEPP